MPRRIIVTTYHTVLAPNVGKFRSPVQATKPRKPPAFNLQPLFATIKHRSFIRGPADRGAAVAGQVPLRSVQGL